MSRWWRFFGFLAGNMIVTAGARLYDPSGMGFWTLERFGGLGVLALGTAMLYFLGVVDGYMSEDK